MKVLLVLIMSILTFSVSSYAEVCMTNYTELGQSASYQDFEDLIRPGDQVYLAKWTCNELDTISDGMEVVGYAVQVIGMGAACTGFGLPVAVTLESAGVALGVASMVVNNLDCDDTDQSAEIQRKVDEALCQALNNQGHKCEVPLQQL